MALWKSWETVFLLYNRMHFMYDNKGKLDFCPEMYIGPITALCGVLFRAAARIKI